MTLLQGDCLKEMQDLISAGVTVDMVLCDLPYGITTFEWDKILPMDVLWEYYDALVKPNGAVVLFGVEPFSSHLRLSNVKNFRYDWVWRKNTSVGFANAKRRPLRDIELISVFYKKQATYNPQGLIPCEVIVDNSRRTNKPSSTLGSYNGANAGFKSKIHKQQYTNYPRQIIDFSVERGGAPDTKAS